MPRHNARTSRSFRTDRRGWFIFLVLVLVVGPLTWAWYHRRVLTPAPVPATEPRPFRLAVLEFGRMLPSGKADALCGAQLEAQLERLRAEGFVPVTASQVAASYHQGTPLPPRSILLTFDGGYLSTYEEAHPVLSKLHWPALMFVETGRQEHRDPIFLFWDRLQLMLDSGVWELGTHGHRPLDRDGTPLAPLPSGEASFRRSRDFMQSNLRGGRVLAFAHLANLTPSLEPDLPPESAESPQLVFYTDTFGVNGPEESSLRLNRLKVDPSWSPDDLARRLNLAMTEPNHLPAGKAALGHWIPDQRPGPVCVRHTPEGILMEGARRSDVWLAGSRWVQDWVFQARIRVDAGEFWIAQEAVYGGRHWRFGGKQDTLYFQDRTPGAPPRTLARLPQGRSIYGWHDWRITRRGAGIWVEMDGRPVSEFPFLLPGRWHGNLGILSAPAGEGQARLEIADARLAPIPYLTRPVSPDPAQAEVQALSGHIADTAALSPSWIVRRQGTQTERTLNQDLLRMIQRRFAWDLLPEVRLLDRDDPASPAWLAGLARRAASAGWSGLKLDLSALPQQDQLDWRKAAGHLEQSLNAKGVHIVMATEQSMKGGI